MGMFDWLLCEYPLPDLPDPTSIEFQTKDLDCLLDNYRITKDGRLMHETYRVEDQSDPNAKGISRIFGMCTRITTGEEDVNFHGYLHFYGNQVRFKEEKVKSDDHKVIEMISKLDGEDREWFTYDAKFTDGKVVEIKRREN